MTAVALVGGIAGLAFVSAFVPVVSIELALLVAAATAPSNGVLVAQIAAAAVGQMLGKSCFFLGGRAAYTCLRSRRAGPSRLRRPSRSRLVVRASGHRGVAAATVFASALTGLPPFAVVSALAGAWRLNLSSFFVLGLVGRSARFGAVLIVPGLVR